MNYPLAAIEICRMIRFCSFLKLIAKY